MVSKALYWIDYRARWRSLEKALLAIVLIDLALGGNGYLIQFGGIRLRVILFAPCLAWALLRITRIEPVKIPIAIPLFLVFYVTVTAFDAALGFIHGSQREAIFVELKPLSYFPMLFFFVVAIQGRSDVTFAVCILVASGTLLAFLHIALSAGTKSGFINAIDLWELLSASDEFIFRGYSRIGFLYKGDFYICVAALFLLLDPFKFTKILASVAVVAIAITETRGLSLAFVLSIMVGVALNREWSRLPLFLGQSVLLAMALLVARNVDVSPPTPLSLQTESIDKVEANEPQSSPSNQPVSSAIEGKSAISAERTTQKQAPAKNGIIVSGDKAETSKSGRSIPYNDLFARESTLVRPTDAGRIADLKWVVQQINPLTALIGRGLGSPIREVDRTRIELNYLEVFYKQGVLGLSIWALLFFYIFRLYVRVPRETKQFGLAFLLSSLFIFIANSTNTVLSGSIGMAMVFIAVASLLVLARETPRPLSRADWYGV